MNTVMLLSAATLALAAGEVRAQADAAAPQTPVAEATTPTQDAEPGNSQDIVVTARKRAESLIEVPLAVTVSTADQLRRDQVYNVSDLQRTTPALEISQTSGGENNGGGRLRGLGTGVFNPSVAPSVAFVTDQVPVGNQAFPQLYDLAQVEVLRGPQGTLFGQGASAGVVNIATAAPSTEALSVSGGVDYADKGTAGSELGEAVVRGAINVPLSDQAALRFATQFRRETGLQRSVTTGRDNVTEDLGFRVRALLKPSERFTVNLIGEYARQKNDGQTFFAIAIAPNATTPFGPPGGTIGRISTAAYTNPAGCNVAISPRAEQYCEDLPSQLELSIGGISAIVDWEIADDFSVTSVSGYRERSFKQFRRDFTRLTGAPAARQERTQEDTRGFSQELRANVTAGALDIIFGGYYTDFQFDRVPTGEPPYTFGSNLPANRTGFGVCLASGAFCAVPTSFTKELTRNRTLAAFTDITANVTDRVEVFGGLRYSDYRNVTRVGVNTLAPTSRFVTEDGDLSGRIGVSFKPNSDTNLYASFARGYKPPAVGTNPAGQLFELEPEKAKAYEVGAKLGVGPLQLAANAFYTDLRNFQSQVSVFVGTALISQPLNIPRLKSKGVELTVFGELFRGFSVNGGYQFNDVKFPAGFVGDDGGNLGGTQFLNAPKHKVTLSGDYGLPLSDGVEVFLNANVVYKSKVLLAARADPRYRYPAHELVNLGIGLREPGGAWTASLFVRNLTKEREPTAYLASTFAGQADGGIRAWPLAGLTARVVGARLAFAFRPGQKAATTTVVWTTCGGCVKNGPAAARQSAKAGDVRNPTMWSSTVSQPTTSR